MQYPFNQSTNPGLAPFDISNYKGNRGKNFYEEDRVLQTLVEKYSKGYDSTHKKAMIEHLLGYGALVGGILDELTEASHKEGKYGEIVKYDRTGNRIDAVVYSNEQNFLENFIRLWNRKSKLSFLLETSFYRFTPLCSCLSRQSKWRRWSHLSTCNDRRYD